VAAHLAVDPDTVGKWRRRFTEHRLEGLWDEPRSGTPRTIEDARIEAVIVRIDHDFAQRQRYPTCPVERTSA
jgi:transposase